ncbi:MAG: hypothetical protein ABIM74_04190 [candidate division WOR-3 bacterium]
MAKIRQNVLSGIGKLFLRAAKRGLMPKRIAYTLVGLATSLTGASKGPCAVMCYEVPPTEPWISRVLITKNPLRGKFRLTATIKSNERPVGGADVNFWVWKDGQAEVFRVVPMNPADGAFDSLTEEAYADLALWGWPQGTKMNISAYDKDGNHGTPLRIGVEVMFGILSFECEEIVGY